MESKESMPKFKKSKTPVVKKQTRFFENIKPKEAITHWSENARNDKYFKLFLSLWIIPILISIISSLIAYKNLPLQIPLFYSRPWGETQLANTIYIFLPTAGSFLLGIVNFALSISSIQKNKVFSYLLAGTAALVSLLSTITVLNIINLMR